MKTVRFIILATVLTVFVSCKKERISGHGPVRNENRAIINFARIHALGATAVFVTQGTNFKVEVSGYGNLISYFETNLLNDILTLGYRDNVKVKNDNVKVYITLPVLKGLSISGSGNINATGTFSNVPVFETNIYGSGNIYFSYGTTQDYFSTIPGSGNVHSFGMLAENTNITISGSGNQEATVSNNLKVNIAGSGNVYYKGNPVINARISGSGAIIPR